MFNNINLTSLAQMFVAQNEPDKIWNDPTPEPLVTPQGDKSSWIYKNLGDYDKGAIKAFLLGFGVTTVSFGITGLIAYNYMKQKTRGIDYPEVEPRTIFKLSDPIVTMCKDPDKIPDSIGNFLSRSKPSFFDIFFEQKDNKIDAISTWIYFVGGVLLYAGISKKISRLEEMVQFKKDHHWGANVGVLAAVYFVWKGFNLINPLSNSTSAIKYRYAGAKAVLQEAIAKPFCNRQSVKKLQKLLQDLEVREQKRNAGMKQRIDTSDTLVPPRGYQTTAPHFGDASRLTPGGNSLPVTPLTAIPTLRGGALLRAVPAEVILPKVI